ncbi:MAG: radical SAM protein [Candidatus Omnitrophota bacterium]
MKIILIRAPSIIGASASTAPICPPVGLAYLKAVINRFTDDCLVIDPIGNLPQIRPMKDHKKCMLLGQSLEELIERVPSDSELILVSIMFSQDWPYAREFLKALRKKAPQAKILAGGEHVTALPEYSMKESSEIDLCVLGEGELVLEELLSKYAFSKSLPQDLPGTCVRIAGEIKKNPRRELIKDINVLPWPDWNDFPLENYLAGGHGFGVNLGRSMPILASRGCPYQCTFCSSHTMWTTAWRVRTPENVVEEMAYYIKKYKVTNFDFYDLTFVIKKDWIVQFCELLIAKGWDTTWQLPSGTRSEVIDRQVAALLYRAGCRNLSYAPESGSEEVLKMIKKKINLSDMLSSMSACAGEGLSVKANIVCGFPGETWQHLLQTYFFILKAGWTGMDDLSINQFSPYPGSELFDFLIEKGEVKLNGEYFEHLSSYASMTTAHSYSEHLSNRDILIFKHLGTLGFYGVSFLRRPWKLLRVIRNIFKGNETSRLEKTLLSYLKRFRQEPAS